MPIAELFARASSKQVGAGRNGRNRSELQGLGSVPTIANAVGTGRNNGSAGIVRSDRSDLPIAGSEHKKPSNFNDVPTVPTVPTQKAYICTRCGAVPMVREVGGFDRAGWICMRCLHQALACDFARPSMMAATSGVVPARPCPQCGTRPATSRGRHCDACEANRLLAAAARALAGVVATSDEGEFVRAGDEP